VSSSSDIPDDFELSEFQRRVCETMQMGQPWFSADLKAEVLRRSKDDEGVRPLSANRNTIKAMEQRGLIRPGKGRDALTIAWRLKKKIK
jgi:hypothetical protein